MSMQLFCGFLTTSFGDSSFVVLTTSFVLVIAESKFCIEQQIMFICNCKDAVQDFLYQHFH